MEEWIKASGKCNYTPGADDVTDYACTGEYTLAAAAGADAVVLARYGTLGIGALTYGQLEGKGRAVAFIN